LKDLAERVSKSLAKLGAFIVDNRILDSSLVDSLLSSLGVSSLLSKATLGDITVYYVDTSKFRRKCIYEKCSTDNAVLREACVRDCLAAIEKEIIKAVIEALKRHT